MTTILLVILFISQLLTFYFLVILNTKLSRYKDIEKKQEAVIREMDDAISAFLVEVKDENDRLIKELSMQSTLKKIAQTEQQVLSENRFLQGKDKLAESSKVALENVADNEQGEPKGNEYEPVFNVQKIIPKTMAASAYKKQLPQTKLQAEQFVKDVEPNLKENSVDQRLSEFEQEVVDYHRLGMSIEDIAKKTQKGKTEIELLIKFHA